MESGRSSIKIKSIAFYLVLLIVVTFSIPQVQIFLNENFAFTDDVTFCSSYIIQESYIKYFAIAFAVITIPAMILYSRFIYNKFGVFITKFYGKYSPELHFKEFISSNIQNRVFGISLFVVWLCACCFIFYGLAAFAICNLLK
jgi:hypothetical protein